VPQKQGVRSQFAIKWARDSTNFRPPRTTEERAL